MVERVTDGHPYFGPVPAAVLEHVATAGRMLLERGIPRTDPWHAQALADFEALAGDIPCAREIGPAVVERARRALEKRLAQTPAAAMLVQRVDDDFHRATGTALSAWVFAAALQRSRRAPTENAIPEGLDALRRLKQKAPAALAELEPLPQDAASIVTALLQAAETTPRGKTVRGYFRRIAALLKAAEIARAPIHHQRHSRPESPKTLAGPDGLSVLVDGATQDPAFAGPAATQIADKVPDVRGVSETDNTGTHAPRRVAVTRTLEAARASARRSLALLADPDPLTPHEVQILVEACRETADDPALQWLLGLLCFGAALPDPDRPGAAHWATRNATIGLHLTVDLPHLDALLDNGIAADAPDGLFLAAPACLEVALIAEGMPEAEIGPALHRLRPQLARSLALGRIRRWKADWLTRAGADPAIIGFLTGLEPGLRAQMHYTALERRVLEDWHVRVLVEGLGLSPPHRQAEPGRYNARLTLPPGLLRQMFRTHRTRLQGLQPDRRADLDEVAAAHNAFATYTLMLLYLATGHRPVSRPFEFLSDFQLETGLLWISDKTGRGGRGTRLIVLPPSAVAQVRHWCAHLERLAERLALLCPALVDTHVRPALASRAGTGGPLFFLLDGETALPMAPKLQKAAVADVLPTALNWSRHVLRSALADRHAGEVIDAFLGHGHLGEEAFAPGSGLGIRDLHALSLDVEALLADLQALPLESPL